MNDEVRPIRTEDVVAMARELAEAGEPMSHHFTPGSREAIAWERAYLQRRRELDEPEG
jgi:protein tyrosine phosphatase (PTP) superfamily phosphohydrolase (DUF442 family)